jgi:hypothetical protein
MRAAILTILTCTLVARADGQWSTAFTVSRTASRGHAADRTGTEIRPESPRTAALAIAMGSGHWRVAASGRYTEAGLTVAGADAHVVTPRAMSAWGMGLEVHRRVAGSAAGPAVYAGAGVDASHWEFRDAPDDSRWRMSGVALVQGAVAITGRWSVLLRGEVAAGSSLFDIEELPDGYRLRHALRHGVAIGIERRW